MAKRLDSLDIAKGIGILCIILGHLGYTSFVRGEGDPIATYVFQFHVPIFFILAGYTLSERKPFVSFVKDKAQRLLIPYVITCFTVFLILIVLRYLFGHTQPPSIYPGLRVFIKSCLFGAGSPGVLLPEGFMHIGAIWFLEALFVSLVEVRASLKWGKLGPVIVIVLFIVSVMSVSSFSLPCNIQQGLIGGIYVYIGTLLKRARLFERHVPTWALAILVVISLGAYLSGINVSIIRGSFGRWFLGFPVSIATSCLWVFLSDRIANWESRIKDLLLFAGRNSLVILCTHLVLLDCGFKWCLHTIGIPYEMNALFFFNLALQLCICFSVAALVNRYSRPLVKGR